MRAPSLRSMHRLGQLPIWLLIAAWFCANSPQTLTYSLVVWAGNARHFTHQEKLMADVAFVLAGSHASQLVATVQAAPVKPFSPRIPEEATVKKIELAMEPTNGFLPPALQAKIEVVGMHRLPASPSTQLPFEPPRGRAIT